MATPVHAPAFGTQIIDRAVENAKVYLAHEADRVNTSGVKVTSAVGVGNPAEEIVAQAEKMGADLIAMATHRESSLARGILGSVTDRVLHTAKVPLLTIHPGKLSAFTGNAGAPNVVVVPLDGSELAESAVPVALEIADACASEVVFARAVRFPYYGVAGPGIEYYGGDYSLAEQRREALEYLSPFVHEATDRGLKATAHAAVGSPAARIIEELEELEGALVVMTTHGAGGLKRWLVGSVADKVVRSSGHPVLVLRPSEE